MKIFNKDWVDIIKDFGRFDKLYEYLIDEYTHFYKSQKTQNIHKLIKYNKYITYKTLEKIGLDKIRSEVGIEKRKDNYSDKEMEDNFWYVFNSLGRIPRYGEFEKRTNIPINTYADKYDFSGTGVVYEKIIEKYIKDEGLINEYKQNYKKWKSVMGKITGYQSGIIISDEELETEFKRVFDFFLKEYDTIPSRRLVEKHIKYDLSNYRRRYDLSWTEICKKYGYDVSKSTNRSEQIALINVSKVLRTNYEPQKTWSWLIGAGGKNMYCDGYFPEHNLVVEFDGESHRKPVKAFGGVEKFNRLKENDALKEELLAENGIKLIRIDSRTDWDNVKYIEKLLKQHGIRRELVSSR